MNLDINHGVDFEIAVERLQALAGAAFRSVRSRGRADWDSGYKRQYA